MTNPLAPGWHRVEIDGLMQAYEVSGTGPVCLVHSGGPGVNSEYLRMPLLEQHMTLVYLDPIGTGRSGLLPGGDYSVAEYARRLERLRAYADVTDAYLLGHSHGGFVALQYGLDHPGRMRGLIIYSGAPSYSPDHRAVAKSQMEAFVNRWPDRPEAIAAGRMYQAKAAGNYVLMSTNNHERRIRC